MSDIISVLPDGYGTPRAWLFNSSNNVILDKEGRPLSSYMTEFEYVYDEDEDDVCTIKFQFERVEQMDLQYLKQDVILLVQWGYILPNGLPLKSPKRKVAIRDIKTRYEASKLTMEIKCTDLVAYIKSFKTTTVRKYANPNANLAIKTIGQSEDNYLDWLWENIRGEYQATITNEKTGVRMDKFGDIKTAEFDPRTGRYEIARDNTAVPSTFYHNMYTAEIINGKGKAIPNAIKDYLKTLDATKGVGGPYLMDTTDDTIHMRQRNFQQQPFKNFTFGKNTGELITFDSNTDTRKIKEDITSSNTVNPETKLIDATQVVTVDNSKYVCLWPENDPTQEPIQISEELIEKELEKYRDAYKASFENPLNQKELPDMNFFNIDQNMAGNAVGNGAVVLDDTGFYARAEQIGKFRGFQMMKIPAREILMLPHVQTLLAGRKDIEVEKFTNAQALLGYTVEKIQRKYEATAKVLGDPSIIKGKTYGFFNLTEADAGIWYATKVSHKITMNGGYICDMSVIKKPATVTIDKQMAQIKVKEINGLISTENKMIYERLGIYGEVSGEKSNYEQLDENYANSAMVDEGTIEGMEERLDYLGSEERFTMGKTDNDE